MTAPTEIDIGTLIVSTEGIVGGSPRSAGSRISVKHIAEWHNLGMSVEEMDRRLPTVDRTGIYAAITYYLANKAAVDQDIEQEDAEIEAALADPNSRVHRLELPNP